jgi:hypothetical protein
MATTKKASKAKSSKSQTSTTNNVTVITPGAGLKVVKTTSPAKDLQSAIRARAYELYLQRGGQHGHDFDDWLRAEAELRQRYQGRTA